jgi:putative ABC transport system substrate-binding protein
VVAPDALFTDRRDQIVALARRYSVPTFYELREFVTAGGFISYGASSLDEYRQGGTLQPTKFELVINMKTAKQLGLTIPSGILAIVDEVIE